MPNNEYVLKYLTQLGCFLGLEYWVFHVSDGFTDDKNDWAEIHVEDFNEATIELGVKFWQADSLIKTQVLLHELLHVFFSRVNEHLIDNLDSLMEYVPSKDKKQARTQNNIHRKAAARAEEVAVNHLAVVISNYAPRWQG